MSGAGEGRGSSPLLHLSTESAILKRCPRKRTEFSWSRQYFFPLASDALCILRKGIAIIIFENTGFAGCDSNYLEKVRREAYIADRSIE
jgi:hypothetical protein